MKIYLDNNASTRVDQEVVEAMIPYFTEIVAPPSSDYGHSFGIEAKQALDSAREIIATKLNVEPKEIIFTSGQAESNNLAIKGIALTNLHNERKLLVASKVSHSSVLDSLTALKKLFGFKVELLNVDSEGFVDRSHLQEILSKKPLLVSVPHGNVEIGTIEDIEDLAQLCHKHGVPLHLEATYSFCKIPFDASTADLATVASHLIHGPKGVGALYIKTGIKTKKLIDGGLQENKMRGGTENIPGIIGFAKAVSLYTPEIVQKCRELRDHLWDQFEQGITDYQITGPINKDKRLPNHFSAVINYVEGESILLHSDILGFEIATGSACSSKQLKASHVLTAIGLPTEISHGSIRMGVSKYNTKEQITQYINHLGNIVERLRAMSPMNAEFMREWEEMKARGEISEEDHHHNH
ncbi:MAG: cysteine desulfurase family protein [Candidatus Hermodarchaeota archaeon]